MSTLSDRIATLDAATQASVAVSTSDIKALVADNLANLQAQLAGTRADAVTAQTQAQLNFIAHGDQIALLEGKLNLSDEARSVLKTQTDQTIEQLKVEQATVVTRLQEKIDREGALRTQLNDEAKQLIDAIKAEQAQLLTALQSQAADGHVLKGLVETSVAALQHAGG